MTTRLELGSIDLIAMRYKTGTGEYEWVEHDEQPSYSFTFEDGGCSDGGAVLTKDALSYIVRPYTFTCRTANSKTAAVNRDNLIAVLDAATAYTLKATSSPAYTGSPVLLIRQADDQATPDVWMVKRYQRKKVRLDLDKNRITLEVDLYCTEGGPIQVAGVTQFGANGNPVLGGPLNGAAVRVIAGSWTRTGGDAPRSLGTWGNEIVHVVAGSWTRTGGA